MSERPKRVTTVEHPETLEERILVMIEDLEALLMFSADEIKFENIPHLMSARKSLLLLLTGMRGVPITKQERRIIKNIAYGWELRSELMRDCFFGLDDDEEPESEKKA